MRRESKVTWTRNVIWTVFLVILLVTPSFSNSCEDEYAESIRSGANDVIVVQQKDGHTLMSTPFQVQVGKLTSFLSFWYTREGKEVQIWINGVRGRRSLYVTDSGLACFEGREKDIWTSDEWHQVPFEFGRNDGLFHIPDLGIDIPFSVYVFHQNQRLVVTDVDGTITESDIKGHVYSILGSSAHHKDVVPLMAAISKHNYQPIYLTARSLAQDDETKDYLFGTLSRLGLPEGPVLLSPKTLGGALFDSTVGSPRWIKAQTIEGIVSLFEKEPDVIWGAYGNREHDAQAYRDAGIQLQRIFIVNPQGVIRRGDGQGKTSNYTEQLNQISDLYPEYKMNTN